MQHTDAVEQLAECESRNKQKERQNNFGMHSTGGAPPVECAVNHFASV